MDKGVFHFRATVAAVLPDAWYTIRLGLRQSRSGTEAKKKRQGQAGTISCRMDPGGTTRQTQRATVAALIVGRSKKYLTVRVAINITTNEASATKRMMTVSMPKVTGASTRKGKDLYLRLTAPFQGRRKPAELITWKVRLKEPD